MATKFRYVPSCNLSYRQQGLVWFKAQAYKRLENAEKAKLRAACREAGGEYDAAIFEYMTTTASWRYVCEKHHISDATLQRVRKRFYEVYSKMA